MGQVGLYIAEGHSAFIFRILQSKPDPEDEGTIVLSKEMKLFTQQQCHFRRLECSEKCQFKIPLWR
jgi:hypothetical protein